MAKEKKTIVNTELDRNDNIVNTTTNDIESLDNIVTNVNMITTNISNITKPELTEEQKRNMSHQAIKAYYRK